VKPCDVHRLDEAVAAGRRAA